MASLLICCFLGPKFIEYIRTREFGQQIREEGPAGHHGKAGTPTMGGLIIFLAVTATFLILDAPFDTDDATAALVGELVVAGDVVLVKGSRGVGLEVVAEALMAAEEAPHG